jgi:hypothetical protein
MSRFVAIVLQRFGLNPEANFWFWVNSCKIIELTNIYSNRIYAKYSREIFIKNIYAKIPKSTFELDRSLMASTARTKCSAIARSKISTVFGDAFGRIAAFIGLSSRKGGIISCISDLFSGKTDFFSA